MNSWALLYCLNAMNYYDHTEKKTPNVYFEIQLIYSFLFNNDWRRMDYAWHNIVIDEINSCSIFRNAEKKMSVKLSICRLAAGNIVVVYSPCSPISYSIWNIAVSYNECRAPSSQQPLAGFVSSPMNDTRPALCANVCWLCSALGDDRGSSVVCSTATGIDGRWQHRMAEPIGTHRHPRFLGWVLHRYPYHRPVDWIHVGYWNGNGNNYSTKITYIIWITGTVIVEFGIFG